MKRKNIISTLNEMLNNDKKLTLESLVFNESDYSEDMDNYVDDDDYSEDEGQKKTSFVSFNGIQDKINQIRQICLQSITELADNPTSPEYEFMKKIWNLCDKTLETKKENIN